MRHRERKGAYKVTSEHMRPNRKGKIVTVRKVESYHNLEAAKTRAGFLTAMGYRVKITKGKRQIQFP